MLHREPGKDGRVDWRQISGLDEHGEYHHHIPDDECLSLARQTKEYECAFLSHEISFLECMQEHFSRHCLRHSRITYSRQMRRYSKGYPVTVMVYHNGSLEPNQVLKSP